MFPLAFGNLRSRPARSLLATAGLAIAIAAMVGLFSIAEGIDNLIRSTFDDLPGLLVQQQGAPFPLFSTLPAQWQRELEGINGAGTVTPEVWVRANLINGKTIVSPPRLLCGVEIPTRIALGYDVYQDRLEEGRFFTLQDVGTANCIISKLVAEEFRVASGDRLVVNGLPLKVIGIYSTGSILLDVAIFADIDVVRRASRFDPETVSSFYVEPQGGVSPEVLQARVEAHFEQPQFADRSAWVPSSQRGLPGLLDQFAQMLSFQASPVASGAFDAGAENTGAEDEPADRPVEVRSADDWSTRVEEFSGDLDLFLLLLTTIGVLIAVSSIVNTMLMSVTERTTEFGILRANGWSQGQILRLITFESGLLGVAGGICGSALGWLGVQVVNALYPQKAHLYASPWLLAGGVLVSIALGVLGGLYPAWRAARMSPMNAIRRMP